MTIGFPDDTIALRVGRHVDASPERVFDAWLDPALARRFLFATPTGEMTRVDIDPRVGGTFCIVERRGDEDAAHHGRYLEIDRPYRLVFVFSTEQDGNDGSRVTVDFAAAGDGCDVTLLHEMGRRWADYAERTRQGWTSILDTLASHMDTAT